MKRCATLILLGIVAGAAVLGYNLWAFCCGRCTLRGFLVIGPVEQVMIGLTCLGALLLAAVKLVQRRRRAGRRCRCGSPLADSWCFCPDCGSPRR